MDNIVLLFCPERGGWHTGVRFEERWPADKQLELLGQLPEPESLLLVLWRNIPSGHFASRLDKASSAAGYSQWGATDLPAAFFSTRGPPWQFDRCSPARLWAF